VKPAMERSFFIRASLMTLSQKRLDEANDGSNKQDKKMLDSSRPKRSYDPD